jgi:hypothetical protein
MPMRSIGQSHLSLTYPTNSKFLINKKQLYSIEALVVVFWVLGNENPLHHTGV